MCSGPVSGAVRGRRGVGVFEEEEALMCTAGAGPWWGRGAEGQRLGIEDAEFLVELLRDLARELHQVAAVQAPVGPVEPADTGNTDSYTAKTLFNDMCIEFIYLNLKIH